MSNERIKCVVRSEILLDSPAITKVVKFEV